ncbi:unnamed protein product [Prorocentrum cordatum]|uniref:Uncharacterized protein n=1 Tax=Prorocentrum cordatum TaxID=2364126 RepID=A0ABN9UX00_9DINO|nr:unnamed protein product [Polarella glacialis]
MKRSVAGTRPRDDGACGGIAPGWPVAALGDAERGWRGQDGGGGGGGVGARLRLMRSSCFMKTECYKACSLSNRRF